MKPRLLRLFALLAATLPCAPLAPAAEVEAASGKPELAPGKFGSAALLTGSGAPLVYPEGLLHSNAGTIEMWVKPEQPAAAIELAPLASMGNPGPDSLWLLVSIAKGKLGFLMQKGAKPFSREGDFYASVAIDVADWKAGEWHHLAVAWAARGPGQSVVKVYADGALRDARYNLNLSPEARSARLGFGVNTAALQGPRFLGFVDEVRVSNTPRVDAEVKQAFDAARNGKPLAADEATLLFLNFDQGAKGERKATRALTPAEAQGAAEKLAP
jgi:hypothetical protein